MGKPNHVWVRNISIDPSLREYHIRLTPKWMAAATTLASKSLELSDIVYDLGNELRSIELTASMPYNMVGQCERFAESFIRGSGETNSQTVARFIAARLVRRMDLGDAELREQLLAECLQLSSEIKPVRTVPGMSADDIWAEYLTAPGFRLALSACQSQAIAAAYNSYEAFLVRTVRTALGMSDGYRKRSDEKFQEKLVEAFGQPICDTCFNGENVQLFRLLRHAISHNGGRITPDLEKIDHPFHVVGGVIQFMPQQTKTSLRIVERCVNEVLTVAAEHPRFKRKRKSKR